MNLTDIIDINKQWVKDGAFIRLTTNQRRILIKTTYAGMISKGYYPYTAPTPTALQKEVNGFIPVMQDGIKVGETRAVVGKTAAEIAADLVVLKNSTIDGNRLACTSLIYATYPDLYQKNVGLGIYIDTLMVPEIKLMIKEENRAADLVDAAVDTAGVAAAQATLAWPTIGGA